MQTPAADIRLRSCRKRPFHAGMLCLSQSQTDHGWIFRCSAGKRNGPHALYISCSDQKKFLFEQLYEIFSYPPSRPDGIFLDEDSSLLKVLKIAGECGYIPEHKLGCYNTPWSHGEGGFSFPSISISPDECAEQLLKQVLTPKDLRQDVYVAPYLNNNQ